MRENPQADRDNCYFCHEQDTQILESHHIVPRRFDGSDTPENLVTVCPNCHSRLERLYDARFYDALGVEAAEQPDDRQDDDDDTPLTVTTSADDTEELEPTILDIIEEWEHKTDSNDGVPVGQFVRYIQNEYGIDNSEIHEEIERLKQTGEIYEPTTDRIRTT